MWVLFFYKSSFYFDISFRLKLLKYEKSIFLHANLQIWPHLPLFTSCVVPSHFFLKYWGIPMPEPTEPALILTPRNTHSGGSCPSCKKPDYPKIATWEQHPRSGNPTFLKILLKHLLMEVYKDFITTYFTASRNWGWGCLSIRNTQKIMYIFTGNTNNKKLTMGWILHV